MKRKLVAGLAVMLIAAGLITIVTVASVNRRSQPAVIGVAGTTADDNSFIEQDEVQEAVWMEDFTLTERSGKPFHSAEMEGKVWVASFFFTACTQSCKDQNSHLYRLQKDWGPKGVTFVSITCDPATDGTARLREYANDFSAHPDHWLFLTGDLETIQRVGAEVFGVTVQKGLHMDRFTVIDKWGKVRGQFNWHDPLKRLELQQSLEKLLAETEEPGDAADACAPGTARSLDADALDADAREADATDADAFGSESVESDSPASAVEQSSDAAGTGKSA